MKLKNLAALSMAAVLCVMTAGCGADNGKDSAKKDSTGEEPKQTSQAEQDSDELVINYVSARGETDAALNAIKKIAGMYKEDHPNFEFNVESIADRATYLQKIKILASSNELPDWFDADPEAFFEGLCKKGLIYSIDDLYDELDLKDKFFDIALNYPKLSDGSNYLMAWQGNVEYFWYHKDMIMRYPAFKAFRMEGNDFIDNARMGKKKFDSETGIASGEFFQQIAQYYNEGWTNSDATAQMDLFLNKGAAILYTGTWDTPDLTDENMVLKDDISMFKLPMDTDNDATTENDYYAHCGIGTAILKDSMTPAMKDFIKYLWENFADTAMYDFNMLPSMMPSNPEQLPELSQQILSDLENCGTFAQCWDVRLDPSTNEVYRKELANLGMGESTPEEFCKRMDEAVAQYAPDYFDVE